MLVPLKNNAVDDLHEKGKLTLQNSLTKAELRLASTRCHPADSFYQAFLDFYQQLRLPPLANVTMSVQGLRLFPLFSVLLITFPRLSLSLSLSVFLSLSLSLLSTPPPPSLLLSSFSLSFLFFILSLSLSLSLFSVHFLPLSLSLLCTFSLSLSPPCLSFLWLLLFLFTSLPPSLPLSRFFFLSPELENFWLISSTPHKSAKLSATSESLSAMTTSKESRQMPQPRS